MNYQGIAHRASCVGNSLPLPSCQREVPKHVVTTKGCTKIYRKSICCQVWPPVFKF